MAVVHGFAGFLSACAWNGVPILKTMSTALSPNLGQCPDLCKTIVLSQNDGDNRP